LGALTEVAGAAHYGDKVKNKEEAFPATHADLKYTAQGSVVAPFQSLVNVINDPGNGKNWGELLGNIYLLRSLVKDVVGASPERFDPKLLT